ncbi:MAG: IS66 family insertion sequence element accessory protein TnpA [Polyangiaceae bacterium]
MEEESKTADGRRRWRHWTEEQARAALVELAQSGVSVAKFAEIKGVSVQRLAYWRKRLRAEAPTRFVPVDVSTATRSAEPRIEIVVDGVVLRVREELDADKVVDLVDALARRPRRC